MRIPVDAPRANAYAERWIRSMCEEYLDQLLIFHQAHLKYVLREYGYYFNTIRPHQGIAQKFPDRPVVVSTSLPVKRSDIRGGGLHNHYGSA